MIQHDTLKPYAERYAALPMEPLRITAELYHDAHVVAYDAIHFDGILAAAVVMEATEGHGLPPSYAEPYDLPLPLECLWRSDAEGHSFGLPLWAASCLLPCGERRGDVIVMHKRVQTGEFTKATRKGRYSINTTTGRWMERRVMTPTMIAKGWEAYAVGDREEVARLLAFITHIGKRRGSGFGEVRRWNVEPADAGDVLIRDGMLARPIPSGTAHLLNGNPSPGALGSIAWTPPYWHPATQGRGWGAGTPIPTTITEEEAVCV